MLHVVYGYRLRASVFEFIVKAPVGDDELHLQPPLIAKRVELLASVRRLCRIAPDRLHNSDMSHTRGVQLLRTNARAFARGVASKSLAHPVTDAELVSLPHRVPSSHVFYVRKKMHQKLGAKAG